MPTEFAVLDRLFIDWWSRKTSLEKRLTKICTIVALLAVTFLTALILIAANSSSTSEDSLCLSSECVAESATVLRQMNLSADPCDDFYEFACGTFLRDTVIPDDKTTVSAFTARETELNHHLRMIVQEPIHASEIKPFQDVKRLYRACLNTSAIEDLSVTPVRTAINNMGGWPVLEGDTWNETAWTWPLSVQRSRDNGYSVDYFMSVSVGTDYRNSSKRIIVIDQAKLGLEREYLIKNTTEPFVAAYHSYQVDLAVLFGADPTRAADEMMDALNFEIKLARISSPRQGYRLLSYFMTVQLLQVYNYVGLNWLAYLNGILSPQSQLTGNDTVFVKGITFFQQLRNLLDNTPKRVLANYVAWRHAFSSVDYLPKVFRQRQLEYERLTSGRVDANPRWLECIATTLRYYPLALGALYVRKHFNKEAKAKTLEMVTNIKNEFKIMLSELEWMDDETKASATEKFEKIRDEIGFADELLNDEALGKYYAAVPVVVDEIKYYQSITDLNIAATTRANMRLREAVNKTEWSSYVAPAMVNAYYSVFDNSIKFPAGILQGVFFNPKRPQYMNYGRIGFIIGHELTHGFDDLGSQFDGQGNFRNWWANATKETFSSKTQCITTQYGNYTEPLTHLKLNGIYTKGENIADNGGVKESYHAYNRWAKNNSEPKLHGLDFTPQQMFWISYGQLWCTVYREQTVKDLVTTNGHSPSRFRVIGSMSNMKEFSTDFNCAIGTKMNPVDKCEVW